MSNFIDADGTVDNIDDGQGHDFITTLCEVIDNSKDAKAKNVKIWVSKDTVTISDDGLGMNREKLQDSFVINKRSSDPEKIGRFGAGLKAFIIKLLGKNSDKISKTISSNGGSPEYVRFTRYNPATGGAFYWPVDELGDTAKAIWNKYKLSEIGTVIQVPINMTKFEEIKTHFYSSSITENLRFQLGRTFYAFDFNINIDFEGVEYQVPKISPITDHSRIFKGIGDYEVDGKKFTITSCWVENTNCQDSILAQLGIKYNKSSRSANGASDKKMIDLGGKFISRGGRIISRQDVIRQQSKSHDHDKTRLYIQIRHVIDFTASPELDSLFGVSVNKSMLNPDKIDSKIKIHIKNHISSAEDHFNNILKNIPPTVQSPDTQSETESDPEYNPQPSASRSGVPNVDSSTESDTESEISVDPSPPRAPEITFTMMTGEKEIIIKYGDNVLYNVPCPKKERASYKKILTNISKSKSMTVFKQYVEGLIELNRLILD